MGVLGSGRGGAAGWVGVVGRAWGCKRVGAVSGHGVRDGGWEAPGSARGCSVMGGGPRPAGAGMVGGGPGQRLGV